VRGSTIGKKYKIFTLCYSAQQNSFQDEEFRAFMEYQSASLVSAKFFYANSQPAWTMLVEYSDAPSCKEVSSRHGPLPAEWTSLLPPVVDTIKELVDDDVLLYNLLRQWRNNKAKECGYSPGILFTNEQLAKMAKLKPCSLQKLREIPGVGNGKEEKYGADLVGIIQNFLQRKQPPNHG
ncbi:MAG: HRDC domain-containing protein, partial [Candidatus Brocadiae bacterium]|nr:HRDC domain-containing protein [Candidatus Brocadiia bacterium]